MILIGNILIGLGTLLSSLISFFIFLFIAKAVLSWVSPDPYNPIVQFINNCTEPILRYVRRVIPPLGMFDISIIIAILILIFVQSVLGQSLIDYGKMLKFSSVSADVMRRTPDLIQ